MTSNETFIQYFHWYSPENVLWAEIAERANELADKGITGVWMPPATKASSGAASVGYDIYDLYDLGEFNQKGSVRTKYGTLEQYQRAVAALHAANIKVIADIVLNHKAGGDELETIAARKVDPENRTDVVSDVEEIEAFTRFTFPGRGDQYSSFKWDAKCFTGVDYNHKTGGTDIYNFLSEYGDDWEQMISDEKGNYDFLMFADIEFRNPAVREELAAWGKWYFERIGFDGVRLDAVKHISPKFFNEWLIRLRQDAGRYIFAVGEYWAPGDLDALLKYMEATEGNMSLFDSALHHRLHQASVQGNAFDLSSILENTLVNVMPDKAVTVTDNHDTQPLQALEAPVEEWFKPLAYALILLRQEGLPCVFYPDLYGATYKDKGKDGNEYEIFLNKIGELENLLLARKNNAYGLQRDYFDHCNCIGWTREGDEFHTGCAVLMSNGDIGKKKMEMGARNAGVTLHDLLGKSAPVILNEAGWGEFECRAGSVSVWVPQA